MKKIMFNDRYDLTKTVIEGSKTQTRRLIPESVLAKMPAFREKFFSETLDLLEDRDLLLQYFLIEKYGKTQYLIGEVVAVAYSYETIFTEMSNRPKEDFYPTIHIKNIDSLVKTARSTKVADILKLQDHSEITPFKATKSEIETIEKRQNILLDNIKSSALQIINQAFKDRPGWKNKMFVKADLMPFRIRITDIRIEHLQDISEQDCMAEGVRKWEDEKEYLTDETVRKSIDELKEHGYTAYSIPGCWNAYPSAREAYAALIDKVSGKGTWEKNPWVFVYDFELVK